MSETPKMEWTNEPQNWTTLGDTVAITSDPKTDFWRKTHYGFIRDNGHFYHRPVTGDFVADVRFSGAYTALYDQAGLMVQVDEATWIKCGIEFVGGVQHVSAVVTRDYSDWSVVPLPQNPSQIWLRVVRQGSTIEVFYALDGAHYTMIRTAFLSAVATAQVGLMCAAPEGDGFAATFEDFTIRTS
jgi:hypothetical protein